MRKKQFRGRLGTEPNPVDSHVGNRVRMYRTLKGLTQEKLGEYLGLTFQQVQKYEKGLNRIGASRLWDISQVLETPIELFYEGIAEETKNLSPRHVPVSEAPQLAGKAAMLVASLDADPLSRKETLDLIRSYYSIPDRILARKLFDLIKTLASPVEDEDLEKETND